MENKKSPEGQELILRVKELKETMATLKADAQNRLKITYYMRVAQATALLLILVQLSRIYTSCSNIYEKLVILSNLLESNLDILGAALLVEEQTLSALELIYQLILHSV